MFASFKGTCSEGDPYIRRIDSFSSFSFAFMNSYFNPESNGVLNSTEFAAPPKRYKISCISEPSQMVCLSFPWIKSKSCLLFMIIVPEISDEHKVVRFTASRV